MRSGHLSSGDVDGQFIAPPTCPNDTFTFSCTVGGDSTGTTFWRVGGSSGFICTLSHSTPVVITTCGPGGVLTARFDTTNASSFSSLLSGPATTELDGTLVECFGPAFSQDAENRVGNGTVQTIG